jgi:3-deoxy-D-manno-octulosonic-acid transferase
VERKGEILQQLAASGLKVVLRSRLQEEKGTDPDILLVDSTGELRDLYPACELVFIGKTLTGKGGQNFLEAARHGRAIVAGPHMDNFQSLRREFLTDQAMVVSVDLEGLKADLDRLLASSAERQELGRRARTCFREHLGAGARHVESILPLLDSRQFPTACSSG